MKVKLIKHKGGYLGVSDEKISVGDWYFVDNQIVPALVPYNEDGVKKILFTTPDLELEGVPLIDLIPEEVLRADKYCNDMRNHAFEIRDAFIDGYNEAKELYKFTEDDVRNVIEIAEEMGWDKCRKDLRLEECYNQSSNDSEQILIQLSQPKGPIAVEIETTTIHSPTDPANYYDVEVIKTQTIDGKEYCIINKIYYK